MLKRSVQRRCASVSVPVEAWGALDTHELDVGAKRRPDVGLPPTERLEAVGGNDELCRPAAAARSLAARAVALGTVRRLPNLAGPEQLRAPISALGARLAMDHEP